MDTLLQRLVAKDAILDVLHAYCDALDRMELERVPELFTEDCLVRYGPSEALQARGAKELAASLARLWRWRRTSHHLSNVVVTFDGASSATACSYVIAWHEAPDGSSATLYGQYEDRLVLAEGRWRIAERRQMMNGSDSGFRVALFPLARRQPPADWVRPDPKRFDGS